MKFLKKIRKSQTDSQKSLKQKSLNQKSLNTPNPSKPSLSKSNLSKQHPSQHDLNDNSYQGDDPNDETTQLNKTPNNKPQTPNPQGLTKSKKTKQTKSPVKNPDPNSDTIEMVNKTWMGFDQQDFVAGRGYWFMMTVLCVLILAVAVKKIEQTQTRHQLFIELSTARQNYRQMHTEEQKLIIEQQTFSATPIVARRAVSELSMFYPLEKDRIVIIPPAD